MLKLGAKVAAISMAVLATLSIVTPAANATSSGEWTTYGPYSFVFDLQNRMCMISISGGATYEGACAASSTRGRWHVRYNSVTHLVVLHNVAYDTCLNVDGNFKVTTSGCSSVWTQGFNEEKIANGTSKHSGVYMYHPLADASKCLVRGWYIGSCSDRGATYYQYYNAP